MSKQPTDSPKYMRAPIAGATLPPTPAPGARLLRCLLCSDHRATALPSQCQVMCKRRTLLRATVHVKQELAVAIESYVSFLIIAKYMKLNDEF